ncbi:MAG: hypothetical protein ACK48R_12670 [Planctomyces sp.]
MTCHQPDEPMNLTNFSAGHGPVRRKPISSGSTFAKWSRSGKRMASKCW